MRKTLITMVIIIALFTISASAQSQGISVTQGRITHELSSLGSQKIRASLPTATITTQWNVLHDSQLMVPLSIAWTVEPTPLIRQAVCTNEHDTVCNTIEWRRGNYKLLKQKNTYRDGVLTVSHEIWPDGHDKQTATWNGTVNASLQWVVDHSMNIKFTRQREVTDGTAYYSWNDPTNKRLVPSRVKHSPYRSVITWAEGQHVIDPDVGIAPLGQGTSLFYCTFNSTTTCLTQSGTLAPYDTSGVTLNQGFINNGYTSPLSTSGRLSYSDNLFNASAGLTIEAWVNTTNLSGSHFIYYAKNLSVGRQLYFQQTNGGGLSAFIYNGSAWIGTTSASAFGNDSWTYVAMTFDFANGNLSLYRNGSLVKSIVFNPQVNLDFGHDGFVGFENNSGTIRSHWHGQIDEFRLTQGIIDRSNFTAHYCNNFPSGTGCPGTDNATNITALSFNTTGPFVWDNGFHLGLNFTINGTGGAGTNHLFNVSWSRNSAFFRSYVNETNSTGTSNYALFSLNDTLEGYVDGSTPDPENWTNSTLGSPVFNGSIISTVDGQKRLRGGLAGTDGAAGDFARYSLLNRSAWKFNLTNASSFSMTFNVRQNDTAGIQHVRFGLMGNESGKCIISGGIEGGGSSSCSVTPCIQLTNRSAPGLCSGFHTQAASTFTAGTEYYACLAYNGTTRDVNLSYGTTPSCADTKVGIRAGLANTTFDRWTFGFDIFGNITVNNATLKVISDTVNETPMTKVLDYSIGDAFGNLGTVEPGDNVTATLTANYSEQPGTVFNVSNTSAVMPNQPPSIAIVANDSNCTTAQSIHTNYTPSDPEGFSMNVSVLVLVNNIEDSRFENLSVANGTVTFSDFDCGPYSIDDNVTVIVNATDLVTTNLNTSPQTNISFTVQSPGENFTSLKAVSFNYTDIDLTSASFIGVDTITFNISIDSFIAYQDRMEVTKVSGGALALIEGRILLDGTPFNATLLGKVQGVGNTNTGANNVFVLNVSSGQHNITFQVRRASGTGTVGIRNARATIYQLITEDNIAIQGAQANESWNQSQTSFFWPFGVLFNFTFNASTYSSLHQVLTASGGVTTEFIGDDVINDARTPAWSRTLGGSTDVGVTVMHFVNHNNASLRNSSVLARNSAAGFDVDVNLTSLSIILRDSQSFNISSSQASNPQTNATDNLTFTAGAGGSEIFTLANLTHQQQSGNAVHLAHTLSIMSLTGGQNVRIWANVSNASGSLCYIELNRTLIAGTMLNSFDMSVCQGLGGSDLVAVKQYVELQASESILLYDNSLNVFDVTEFNITETPINDTPPNMTVLPINGSIVSINRNFSTGFNVTASSDEFGVINHAWILSAPGGNEAVVHNTSATTSNYTFQNFTGGLFSLKVIVTDTSGQNATSSWTIDNRNSHSVTIAAPAAVMIGENFTVNVTRHSASGIAGNITVWAFDDLGTLLNTSMFVDVANGSTTGFVFISNGSASGDITVWANTTDDANTSANTSVTVDVQSFNVAFVNGIVADGGSPYCQGATITYNTTGYTNAETGENVSLSTDCGGFLSRNGTGVPNGTVPSVKCTWNTLGTYDLTFWLHDTRNIGDNSSNLTTRIEVSNAPCNMRGQFAGDVGSVTPLTFNESTQPGSQDTSLNDSGTIVKNALVGEDGEGAFGSQTGRVILVFIIMLISVGLLVWLGAPAILYYVIPPMIFIATVMIGILDSTSGFAWGFAFVLVAGGFGALFSRIRDGGTV